MIQSFVSVHFDMPIKVHVKGKRKAPLPPIKSPEPPTTTTTTPVTDNGTEASAAVDAKPKKKAAPTPPTTTILSPPLLGPEQRNDKVTGTTTATTTTFTANMLPNNLSECSSPGRLLRKNYDSNIFLNIIGASMSSDKCSAKDFDEISSTERGTPVLQNFRLRTNDEDGHDDGWATGGIAKTDIDRTTNGFDDAVAHRNFLMWNCQYCTLENPFWKMACAVCDNVKPYDLPLTPRTASTTTPMTAMAQNANDLNLNSLAYVSDSSTNNINNNNNNNVASSCRDSNSNNNNRNIIVSNALGKGSDRLNDVKIDNLSTIKENNRNNTYDEIYSPWENENVAAAPANQAADTVHPYAVDVVYRKKVINKDVDSVIKRNSEIIIKDYPTTTLEMEKQRLRAVIRSMNNRAMSEKSTDQPAIAMPLENNAAFGRKNTPDYVSIEEVASGSDSSKLGAKRKKDAPKDSLMLTRSPDADVSIASVTDMASKPRDAIAPPIENRERSMKVSTSVQTDGFVKSQLPQTSSASPASRGAGPSHSDDLPDDYYDYIGNLSMYGDQDVFTNTLKKLENAFTDDKNENIFVQMHLSNLHLSMNVPKKAAVTSPAPTEKSILVNLYINFNNAVEIEVQPNMLLSQLKNKIAADLLPSIEQRIYFNGLLMDKEQTLREYGIKEKSSIYLNTEDVKVEVDNAFKNSPIIPYVGDGMKFIKNDLATAPSNSNNYVLDYQNRPGTSAAKTTNVTARIDQPLTTAAQPKPNPVVRRNRVETTNQLPNPNISKNKYRGVYNYNPRCNPALVIEGEPYLIRIKDDARKVDVTELPTAATPTVFTSTVKLRVKDADAAPVQRQSHYLELLTLDNINDIATNSDAFDCAICFMPIDAGEGVVLRDCLHTFCRDCIRGTITYSEEAEVRCPYIDASYTCESLLQDREVKALLTKEEHDEHLAKSLRVAEHKIENSFHCRTPNCKGWCIYEDNVNQFRCPICSLVNCLTCRVIHDGLDCKQYQENAKNEEGNTDSHTSKKMLEEMVEKGEAMYCPTCRVVLMKKWGCDWLKCSMCKTEICWVTRGPRWGPAGKGDTSGGCKCGIGGFKCHSKCKYCH